MAKRRKTDSRLGVEVAFKRNAFLPSPEDYMRAADAFSKALGGRDTSFRIEMFIGPGSSEQARTFHKGFDAAVAASMKRS